MGVAKGGGQCGTGDLTVAAEARGMHGGAVLLNSPATAKTGARTGEADVIVSL